MTPDRVVVERFCGGEQLPLRPCERRVVVSIFTAEGRSGRWIAQRLGITPRSVFRQRRAIRSGVYA